jgi:hypothetical protein
MCTECTDGTLEGFEICGHDGQWSPAEARIASADTVTVNSTQVTEPVAIRYGWYTVSHRHDAINPGTACDASVGQARIFALLIMLASACIGCLPAAADGHPPDVLALVDADQSTHTGDPGQDGTDGRINLAAIAYHYTHASSYRDGSSPAPNAIDGKPETAWYLANTVTEAWVETSLGVPTPIDRIVLSEPRRLIRWHRVSIHDADGWRPLYEGKGLDPQGRSFPAVVAGALRIEIRTAGGGGLSEIAVYRAPSQPSPAGAGFILRPEPRVVGTSMAYVGFSSVHIVDGENQAAWLRFMGVNGVRTWYTASRHVKKEDLRLGDPVTTVEDFARRRAAVRADPARCGVIDWETLARRSASRFVEKDSVFTVDHANLLLRRLGITPLCELNGGGWDENWQNAWRNWATLYAWVFHQARTAGVCHYEYANEPETFAFKLKPEIYVRSIQIYADAVRSAVEDVNRLHGTALKPVFVAPVLAGSGTSELARGMMRTLRTDFQGGRADPPLVQWFCKHRYNSRPRSYVAEIDEMNAMMRTESPDREALPIIYSEFNHSTGRMWARPETAFTCDTPVVFRNQASVWGLATSAGVKALYQFKFANHQRKSNSVCKTLVREHDPDVPAGSDADIGDSTKNAEVTRLFAEGFAQARPLLAPGCRSADINVVPLCSRDPASGRIHLWLPQPNSRRDYPISLDLGGLAIPPGALLQIKEVSAARFGETVLRTPVTDKPFALVQPRDSVWLVGIEPRSCRLESIAPEADGEVRQGAEADGRFGKAPAMGVRQGSDGNNRIAFIRFRLPADSATAQRVLLRVHGQALGPAGEAFDLLVYGSPAADWDERTLSARQAPAVCRTVSAMAKVDLTTRPVGHLSFVPGATKRDAWIDVTSYVSEHPGAAVTFILIKEKKYPDDDFQACTAEFATREAPQEGHRPVLELWRWL